MKHTYNDGGRATAGYQGKCGDCVVRAIAIATEQPYEQVYQALADVNASTGGRSKTAGIKTARRGIIVRGVAFKRYMAALGWTFTATMGIGTGCTVHLADGELPMGRLVVSVSKHYTTVLDGVIHDTHDPQRATLISEPGKPDRIAQRCVYGYWRKAG
jgi:hypothetical protein